MDFFARQDAARKKTGLLIGYFGMSVAATITLVYLVPALLWFFWQSRYGPREIRTEVSWWYPDLFVLVCGITLIVILSGAAFKILSLRRGGGSSVAEMLGGRKLQSDTDDFFERRLLNVVEEMAIASGVPVPPVYVMDRERAINAFAAGFSISDAVVAVTYGTMTGLTRDELQGVVAHEFSHVLNSDSRMNINLMGIIHGLVIIGITGRIIMEFAGRGASSRSRNSGQAVIFILAAGLILWIIGSCGMLFGKLIKASISRHRERLADASAVQFTRNPAGLSSALKKIGGLSEGSMLRSARAEQASHMFFGKGTRGSLFSTHPPLADRVRWLEPTFNGTFEPVTREQLRAQLTRFEGAPKTEEKDEKEEKKQPDFVEIFTKPMNVAVAGAVLDAATKPAYKPNNPEALIETIGQPMEHHADAARQLLDRIPQQAREASRNPYGARMLIYFLLLDHRPSIRSKQLAAIRQTAEPQVSAALEKALDELEQPAPELRLPMLDLAVPALRQLSPAQYVGFMQTVQALIDADEQVDLFEYVLRRSLRHHLAPAFSEKPARRPVNYYAIRGLAREASVILSVLTRKGHDSEETAKAAFRDAVGRIPDEKADFEFLSADACTWEALDTALDKMNEGSFKVKKWLLGAALAGLLHDREITVEEVELFRAIADTLGCPVPPWVVPAAADDPQTEAGQR